ncbi:olfactory receptor 5AR1-like [Rhineura floridana]|uniref:olfactory receptor 5AR1-like n=1 Tax=Rhineura floridana TaxID=261503 RepID=UPI002AC85128|nr:olfactory receptor 5AR1-like [Rhineura floridana]
MITFGSIKKREPMNYTGQHGRNHYIVDHAGSSAVKMNFIFSPCKAELQQEGGIHYREQSEKTTVLVIFGFSAAKQPSPKKMEDDIVLEKLNYTEVTTFIIAGFTGTKKLQVIYFIIFLLIYLLTLSGNIILLITLKTESSLHTPMYFFLSNLAVLEIGYTSVTLPKLLAISLGRAKAISLTACLAQSYFFFFLGSTECFLLAVMAYDRYVAICNPLRYPILMCNKICVYLALGSWVTGFLNPCPSTILVSRLHFCGNIINHFFCDVPPLLSLSCTNTYISRTIIFINSAVIVLGTFLLTMLSYACILATLLRMSSTKGRQKAFSTCTAHLTVVTLYYGTVIFIYVNPAGQHSMETNKVVSFIYSVVTPMLNPVIYSLRNEDVKKALEKMIFRRFCLGKQTSQIQKHGFSGG